MNPVGKKEFLIATIARRIKEISIWTVPCKAGELRTNAVRLAPREKHPCFAMTASLVISEMNF
jgi:hypothetical protein